MASEYLKNLEENGASIIPDVFNSSLIEELKLDLAEALDNTRKIQLKNAVGKKADGQEIAEGGDGSLLGAAHHVVTQGKSFIKLLELKPCFDLIESYLGGVFILNSFGSVTNLNSKGMYEHGKTIHRDTRSYHPHFRHSIWMLVMIDDFTEENGATYILNKSMNTEFPPDQNFFYENAIRAVGKAGSVALWDGRVWHAAGMNHTDKPRRALTLSFTRPFIKPQLDYVRFFGEHRVQEMSPSLQQLFGYHSRVPTNLEEWYQPAETRFYKSNQG